MSDDIVLFKCYSSDMDAEIAKSVLDSEGIQAMVVRDDASGMYPQFQLLIGVRLMVRQEDLERAHEILDEALDSSSE
jgi:hypothetical protein